MIPACTTLFHYLTAKKSIAGLAKILSKRLRSDRIEALTALADEAVGLPPDQFASKLRQIGIQSKKKPTGILPLPIVCDEQGEPILSFEAVAERWRAHFAEQEDGVAITVQDMLKQTVRGHDVPLMQPEWTDLPTMQDLEAAFRRTARRKAFFEDNVPGDLLAKIPAVLANRAPLQIGGVQGQSSTQATHCLQLVHWRAISCHRSVGFLFVDVQNAFLSTDSTPHD